jgi:hypothetical protein
MFRGIPMNIFDMFVEVVRIAYPMFPEAPLPRTAFASFCTTRRDSVMTSVVLVED